MVLPLDYFGLYDNSLSPYDTIGQEDVCGCVDTFGRVETTMSIAVCLTSETSIVLATDSMLTIGEKVGQAVVNRTHIDGWQKLDCVEKMAVAGIGNIAGYENRIVDLLQARIRNGEIKQKEYIPLTELLAETLNKDWLKWIPASLLSKSGTQDYLLEFVMTGYGQDNKAMIHRILWDDSRRIFAVTPIRLPCYVTGGVSALGWYWLKRIKISEYLHSASEQTLERIATLIICESAKMYDNINDDIQMLIFRQQSAIERVSPDRIRQLKDDIIHAADESLKLLIGKVRDQS